MIVLVGSVFAACSKPDSQKDTVNTEGTEQTDSKETEKTETKNQTSDGQSIRVFQLKVEIDEQLKEYAKLYEQQTGVHVEVESIGGGADVQGALKGYLQADNMPDIFVFEGPGHYAVWKDYLADLTEEPWVKETASAYIGDGGRVYGFPYAVEGYGLAYNKNILEKADIDPATLTTIDAYKTAFEKLEGMKEELGIDSVVSMGVSASGGLTLGIRKP
jgi:raffinose/stachyose/melibiose transport system substrate-binding protein